MQVHHLIPQAVARNFASFLSQIGHNNEALANKLELPSDPATLAIGGGEATTGNALHLGSHGAYSDFVADLIAESENLFRSSGYQDVAGAQQNIAVILPH